MASSTARPSLNCDPEDVISEQQTHIQSHETTLAVAAGPTPKQDEPRDEEAGAEGPVDDDSTLEGYMLWSVAIGVCFGALMMSLDISIIGTVRAWPIPLPSSQSSSLVSTPSKHTILAFSELAADKSARGHKRRR